MEDEAFEDPARELFIWCVLNHRLEMAKFFWEEGKVTEILSSSWLLKKPN